jgi:peptidoglycan/xylan/chitin deacetylase (PgdA/CDA1 family)
MALVAGLLLAAPALAEPCENPEALGTSRTIELDPAKLGRVGAMQYPQTLALAPKEVVLTFDDGPMLPMTPKVLDALRAECVKATFFVVGRQARAHPEIVRQIAGDGHTVANHTENHLLFTMGEALGVWEFDAGFASIGAALAPLNVSPAPFIRFPGLFNSAGVEAYAKRKNLAVMSADLLADDWLPISGEQVFQRAIARLAQKGSGVLLLHDTEQATAQMLPKLLKELKVRGYRIVHIVPAPGTDPVFPAVAGTPPPSPPVHRVAHRIAPMKPVDASNIYASAEGAANRTAFPAASATTLHMNAKISGASTTAKATTPAAASNSVPQESTRFGAWRRMVQQHNPATVRMSGRPD